MKEKRGIWRLRIIMCLDGVVPWTYGGQFEFSPKKQNLLNPCLCSMWSCPGRKELHRESKEDIGANWNVSKAEDEHGQGRGQEDGWVRDRVWRREGRDERLTGRWVCERKAWVSIGGREGMRGWQDGGYVREKPELAYFIPHCKPYGLGCFRDSVCFLLLEPHSRI